MSCNTIVIDDPMKFHLADKFPHIVAQYCRNYFYFDSANRTAYFGKLRLMKGSAHEFHIKYNIRAASRNCL